MSQHHLRIKDSNHGRGVFALDKKAAANTVIFKKGQKLVEYVGDILTEDEVDDRYGEEYTAPYTIASAGIFVDGACRRGAGTMVNHAPGNRANARFSYNARNQTFSIVATKNIRNDTEVLVNYGQQYRFNEGTHHTTKPSR